MAELVTDPERRRRLALGRPREGGGSSRPATGWPRPTRPPPSSAARSVGLLPDPAVARQGGQLSGPRVRPRRHRPRGPRRPAARPGRLGQGELRAGQQPEPGPPEPARRRPGLPRPDARPPRPRHPGRRGPRRPRPEGEDRVGRGRQEAPEVLGGQGPGAVPPGGRRDHRAGRPGVRQGPAAGPRGRGRLGVAPGPPARATAGSPHKAKGAAVAALAAFYGKAGSAEDRYRLVVTVNDAEVYRAEVDRLARGEGGRSSPARPSRSATPTGSGSTSRGGARSATP